ncbi:response regulator [Raoultibacter phocaeensis]|uniref:response regulator n=1 Tax=Raoultibacter phocaeensis TaxID=2479841 RepID=UPI00111A736F|nr:response regulator transcription factor [Raoultibacter phocaeensis]
MGLPLVSLMIVDDHALFRKGLRALVSQCSKLEVVAEAGSGEEALDLLHSVEPDIVLMDINLPGIDGIEAMRRMHALRPELLVIMLSATDFDDQVFESVSAGAAGYLVKNLEPEELFSTIETVYRSGSSISRIHLNQIMKTMAAKSSKHSESGADQDCLSVRECEVLALVASGYTNKEIASELVIAPNTVKAHISKIMDKLGLRNRVELASYAISKGFVSRS